MDFFTGIIEFIYEILIKDYLELTIIGIFSIIYYCNWLPNWFVDIKRRKREKTNRGKRKKRKENTKKK